MAATTLLGFLGRGCEVTQAALLRAASTDTRGGVGTYAEMARPTLRLACSSIAQGLGLWVLTLKWRARQDSKFAILSLFSDRAGARADTKQPDTATNCRAAAGYGPCPAAPSRTSTCDPRRLAGGDRKLLNTLHVLGDDSAILHVESRPNNDVFIKQETDELDNRVAATHLYPILLRVGVRRVRSVVMPTLRQ